MNLICKNCNIEFSYHRKREHCSNKCFSEWRCKPENKKLKSERLKKTSLEKYGCENPAQSKQSMDKARETCLKKYGYKSPSQNKEIKNKQKETSLKRYGVDNPFKNKEIQNKYTKTMLDTYGVKSPLQLESIKEKTKKTCIEKYGVDNPAKSDDIKKKQESTCINKYGVKCPTMSDSIKKKQQLKQRSLHYSRLINRMDLNSIKCLFSEDEYTNGKYDKKYEFECKRCSMTFKDRITNGRIPRCQNCYPKDNVSIPEFELYNFIKSYCPDAERGNRSILSGMELDVYVPSKNIAIEFNGMYWHSELSGLKNKTYHINKTKRCESLGIKLIHIFEDEWLDKQNIIKGKIKHILGITSDKCYARKCKVREISSNESNSFLLTNHIQGSDNSSVRFGAFYDDKLVAVMTFGKQRIALGNKNNLGEYEMYRFCTNKNVIGIGGKLLSNFIKAYNPTKIISYADRRFSSKDNTFYTKIGFKLTKETSPNYWYMFKYGQREYRYNYIKHVLKNKLKNYNPNLSEWENMKDNGYDRIWDCGSLRYELIILQ